jgi:uncharacterized protein
MKAPWIPTKYSDSDPIMDAAATVQSRESANPFGGALLAGLGVFAGFCSGFLGIGGGLVIVPGLMILLDYPIKRALGISVVSIVPVSVVAVITELVVRGGNIHWRTAVVLAASSLLGSVFGGQILRRIPDAPLRWLFAGSLLFAAGRMLMATWAAADPRAWLALSSLSPLGTALTMPVGVLAGITSTLFGLGGGVVTVPCLSLMFRDVGFHAARATSLATIMPTSAFAAYQHQRVGTIDFAVARRLVPPALLGAVLGVLVVNVLSTGAARGLFAAFVALAAVRVLPLSRAARGGTPERSRQERATRVDTCRTGEPRRTREDGFATDRIRQSARKQPLLR